MAVSYPTPPLANALAPSAEDFALMADQAYRALPQEFRDLCGDLIVQIEEFPPDDVLEELGCQSVYELLGLFHGVGMTHLSVVYPPTEPNMIFLYRRPILDHWAEYEDTLAQLITHVLVHEIGHHFGLSDDDMERVEVEAEREAQRGAAAAVQ